MDRLCEFHHNICVTENLLAGFRMEKYSRKTNEFMKLGEILSLRMGIATNNTLLKQDRKPVKCSFAGKKIITIFGCCILAAIAGIITTTAAKFDDIEAFQHGH